MSKWTFIDHITDYLTRPKMGDLKEPNFYPSEAAAVYINDDGEKKIVGKCRRSTFFRFVKDLTNYAPDQWGHMMPLAQQLHTKEIQPDRYLQWIWDAGNMYEEHLINYAKAAGVFIGEQITVFVPNPRISGRIDLVVVNPDNGKLSIVEAKSIYGHNCDTVFGKSYKDGARFGEPRDSNLMQIGIYQWWFANPRSEFEEARLVYGARDTGKYGEFFVRIGHDPVTGNMPIEYKQMLPLESDWITTPITINSILRDGYEYVQHHLDTGQVPERDYDLQYDDAKLESLYDKGELSKADTEKFEKLKVLALRDRVAAGDILSAEEQELHDKYDGKRIKADQKPLEKGDWQCRLCQWRDVCYDRDGNPNDI